MRKLQDTSPIWHALVWIAGYIMIVNLGGVASEITGTANAVTVILVLGYSLALFAYLRSGGQTGRYGLRRPDPKTLRLTVFYVPLFALAFLQYGKGIDPEIGAQAIVIVCALMIGVGFVEELLFRGFLFQAILMKKTALRAIYVSGITFGLGHIVNLLQGYSPVEQLIQVAAAALIGIALGYCVFITRSILPGVLFHILFNVSGSITAPDVVGDLVIVGIMIMVLIPYIVYLHRMLARLPHSTGSTPVEEATRI